MRIAPHAPARWQGKERARHPQPPVAAAACARQAGLEDANAFERLVVRLIPRASPRSVAVGDVVAFTSPLDKSAMMVRPLAPSGLLLGLPMRPLPRQWCRT